MMGFQCINDWLLAMSKEKQNNQMFAPAWRITMDAAATNADGLGMWEGGLHSGKRCCRQWCFAKC